MPAQPSSQLSLGFEVSPSEADLRAAFRKTRLCMSFDRAMQSPAIARCLHAAAKAALSRGSRRRRRSGS